MKPQIPYIFCIIGKTTTILFLTIFFLSTGTTSAQDLELNRSVDELKTKIGLTEGGEKLKWMDSLCYLMYEEEIPGFEPLITETIQFALELDSTRLALWLAPKLLYHLSIEVAENERAIEVFFALESKFPKDQNYSEWGKFYVQGGDIYKAMGNFKEALPYYLEAQTFAEKANDSLLVAEAKVGISHAYSMRGDFQGAAAELDEAIQIYDKIDPNEATLAKRTLAILYAQNGLQEEAKKIREEVIDHARKIRDYDDLYGFFYDQSFDEYLYGSLEEQLRYLDSVEVYVAKLSDDYAIHQLLIAQLSAYSEKGLLDKATETWQKLNEGSKNGNASGLPEYNLAMGQYEFAMGNYAEAAIFGEKEYEAIKDTKSYLGIYLVNSFLSKVYDRLGYHKKAYDYLTVYTHVKDSVESVQKANGFSYYQTLLETEKKEAKIALQESEIQLLDAQNRAKSQLILFGGFGLLALFAIAVLAYSRYFNRKKSKLQTEFSQNLIKDREDQYSHISRELHDSVGQKLMLLVKKIKTEKEDDLQTLAQDSLNEIRSISHGLHPANLRHLGVSAALTSMVNTIDANTDIFFTNNIENIDGVLDAEKELHLYRIIQESLSNMIKHSGAKASSVIVEMKDDTIRAVVSDNGKGFAFSEKIRQGNLGMKTLLERAKIIGSQLYVDSADQKGTRVELTVPVA